MGFFLPLVLITGFFTAGTSAGSSCYTYPWVGDNWFFYGRKHFFSSEDVSFWRNFTENKLICQINHRTLGLLLTLSTTFLLLTGPFRLAALPRIAKVSGSLLIAALWSQWALGVTTIVNHVPIELASLHQIGAMTVLSAVLFAMHTGRRVDKRHI
mmetsp:Transcript_13283/g.22545  ORF Transcript_13283/g.22545 Transcript_13283/m.22545 type:complete len:155 (-) Transcript_13283:327-791(-)